MCDNKYFLSYYQQELFKNNKNKLERCESKRKLMSMSHSASINLTNSDTACLLLENNLQQYAEIVDDLKDKTSVNNYAEFCLSLASNCTEKPNVKSWTSNASQINVDYCNLFSCNNAENVGCEFSKVCETDILLLQGGFKRNSINEANAALKDFNTQNNKHLKEPISKSFIPNKAKANFTFKPNIDQKETRDIDIAFQNHFESRNSNTATSGKKLNFGTFNKIPKQNIQNNENTLNQNNNPFRSARDELIIQNLNKKDSRRENPASNNQLFCYGTNKRSLGARKGGVTGKFVPPLKPEEQMCNQQYDTAERHVSENIEPIDERLKNIDPKMVELIKSEIMDSSAPVAWDDIAGLEFAKSSVQESVVWPILRPDIFTGLRRPPKGILLFGPPGTGKTLIGKCIASQSNSTFFSISASSLTSKWVGDGEKMVRALFAVALVHQPAVVFIDEIDSLLSQRSDSEHESSRRIKTEFLIQLDGAGTGEDDRLLVVGATNRPQELDEAARRRLVKRLYIPLPEKEARKHIVLRLMQPERHNLTEAQIDQISELSEGYSGSDMKNLCQEASLGPIRSIDMRMMRDIQADQVRPICVDDFFSALNRVRASVSSKDLNLYVEWNKLYGSG